MKTLTYSHKEIQRLELLRQYQILDTLPEQSFDDLAFLASQICHTPIALINLIDDKRQWFKAKIGIDVQEMPISIGFAPICMGLGEVLIIPDTLADERFANNPVVTCDPRVRFYTGIPLITAGGVAIGALCIADVIPREITPDQVKALQAISRLVVKQLEIRRNLSELANIKTEYEQAQKALQHTECTFRSFFDSAPMMMGVVKLLEDDILHISYNAMTAKFFGRTLEQMQNRLASELGVPKHYIDNWLKHYRQAESTKAPVSFEYEHQTPQGKKWMKATVSSVAACCSFIPQFAYIVEDITEYKQSEENLRWQEALLRSMTSVSPLAFYVVDSCTDNILYFNDRFCEIWGIEHLKEQMANGSLNNQDIIPDCLKLVTDNSTFAESNKPLQSEENCCVVEDEIWFTNAKVIRRFSTQVRDINDRYFGRLYIFEDITQKKLLEKQFLRTQRMESIGTLASGIAHDLNNVLSPILMSVQLLKTKYQEQRDRQILTIVENNAKRGANLVKQVLAFARGIEGDRTILQIKHLISEMKQIVEQTFPKSIDLITQLQPDLWNVRGDSTQLHQVLMNLCLNARDAMPHGGTLQISASNIVIDENFAKMHLDAKVGSYIVLTVADTGVGIPNDLLDRIFEPFFTTKELGQGTGLGLSTVMGIIKGHGGFITVSSSVAKGTKFQVYLPAIQTDANQAVEDEEISLGDGQLILVVDDEAPIREITATSLENHNYQVLTASDGIEALALYAQYQNKIRAAIIDIMMPNMDGHVTIKTLQKMNPLLPIIAVSGLANSEQISHQINQSIGFMSKPYTAQELLKTLQKLIISNSD